MKRDRARREGRHGLRSTIPVEKLKYFSNVATTNDLFTYLQFDSCRTRLGTITRLMPNNVSSSLSRPRYVIILNNKVAMAIDTSYGDS